MKTLSGRLGKGLMVPLMTYAWVPLRDAPSAGLVKVTVLEALDAIGSQSTRTTSSEATRILSFNISSSRILQEAWLRSL